MNALLIHNDNLPTRLIEAFESSIKLNIGLSLSIQEDFSFDRVAHEFLNSNLTANQFDAIFIPYTLSNQNYLELSGIRLALHIRLTPEFCHTRVPIIFIGHESKEQIAKLTEFPSFLFTSGIFSTSNFKFEALKEQYEWLQKKWKPDPRSSTLSDAEYDRFLDKVQIHPPANYSTHHSIANEWALVRCSSMFLNNGFDKDLNELIDEIDKLNYVKSIHFKHLDAKYQRQKYRKKNQFNLQPIKGISGYRIGIIDDEYNKGWGAFYKYLLSKSDASVVIYDEFDKLDTKDIAVSKIKKWIKDTENSKSPIDSYIIDLRLHDDDFMKTNPDNFTGINIIDYIKKEINAGIPILVVTASNKIWNFQACIKKGVKRYVIKESPETNSTRAESKAILDHFTREIKETSNEVFLGKLYRTKMEIQQKSILVNDNKAKDIANLIIGKNGFLDQIFNLLVLDYENNDVVNQCLLLCFQILENYCDSLIAGSIEYFKDGNTKLSSGFVWLKSGEKKDVFINQPDKKISTLFTLKYAKFDFQTECSKETPISFEENEAMTLTSSNKEGLDASFLVKMIAVLYFRDGVDKIDIEKIIKLRYYRSNIAAHWTGNIKSDYKKISAQKDIVFMFDIFKKIFNA